MIEIFWIILGFIYSFSYTVIPIPDGEWGVMKNGTWTGMVGMILAQVKRQFPIWLCVSKKYVFLQL